MSPLVLLSFLASLLLCCLCFPSVWTSITGGDEFDMHEAGLAVVASRESLRPFSSRLRADRRSSSPLLIGTPFRESGPPACMAKLIMLRHKVSPPPPPRGYPTETHLCHVRCADTAGQHQTAKPHEPSPTSLTYIQRITRPLTAQRPMGALWAGIREAKLLTVYHHTLTTHRARCWGRICIPGEYNTCCWLLSHTTTPRSAAPTLETCLVAYGSETRFYGRTQARRLTLLPTRTTRGVSSQNQPNYNTTQNSTCASLQLSGIQKYIST